MKFTYLLTAATLATVMALPAAAHGVSVFSTPLTGTQELPPNNSGGKGSATITLDDDAMTMRVQASFSDLSGNATAAHIHCCTAASGAGNASPATPVPSFANFPTGSTSGVFDQTLDLSVATNWNSAFINTHGGSVTSAFTALEQGLSDGKAYFNVHSSAFGGGEIRGTLTSAVPEPSTALLTMMGVLGVGAVSRRARRL